MKNHCRRPSSRVGARDQRSRSKLRKRKISKIILGGMLANMCIESHLRELLEQGFEVAVVKDATAGLAVKQRVEAVVLEMRALNLKNFTSLPSLDFILGTGRFLGPQEVEVVLSHPTMVEGFNALFCGSLSRRRDRVACLLREMQMNQTVLLTGVILWHRQSCPSARL
jgi:Isochorismatase family